MENNALGNAIKDARLGLGLSQKTLASLAKTTQTLVCKIEKGISRKSRMDTLLAINSVLKCDLSGPLREAGYSETRIAAINRLCQSQNEDLTDIQCQSQNEDSMAVFHVISSKDKELVKTFLENISNLSEHDKSIIRFILQSWDA